VPDDCRLSSFDPLQIAWAAGFFDGEGSTIAYLPNKKSRYQRLQAAVPQSGHGGDVPEVLQRFRTAALGMGTIAGPNEYGIYLWKAQGLEETQATIALLWRFLGDVKRSQATAAVREVLDGYRSGQLRARRSRRTKHHHMDHVTLMASEPDVEVIERAWAAGFLDAEGCFGTYHSRPRKSGPDWRRIRVSATQHGQVGAPPDVLVRLQQAFQGLGRIERHGDPDDFRWVAEGTEAIDYVLDRTGRWLGTVKSDQAQLALRRFRAQMRLKGDATHCVRGHSYT
jgi:hypothetical protein